MFLLLDPASAGAFSWSSQRWSSKALVPLIDPASVGSLVDAASAGPLSGPTNAGPLSGSR